MTEWKIKIVLSLIVTFGIFMSIAAFIAILANIGFFGESVRTSEGTKWMLGTIVAPIITVVITFMRKELFLGGQCWITIFFRKNHSKQPPEYIFIEDYNSEKSSYEITMDQKKITGKLDLFFESNPVGQPVWKWNSPVPLDDNVIIKLMIEDNNGKKWVARGRPAMQFDAW